MNPLAQRVADAIATRADDLVALAADLIRFDTTARNVGDPARDEAALQRYLADRLAARGATIDLWEPERGDQGLPRMIPGDVEFAGRPQLAARFAGAGGGSSLIFNGHIDVVADGIRDPDVRDGKLYGRGACDMKGGIACMTFAAEVLASLGVRLLGDLTILTVTDEESWGAGGAAAVRRGIRADAAVVTEPSGGNVWVACRGSLIPTITVRGRAGHSGVHPRHRVEGGPVNAIAKMQLVLDGLRRLEEDWRERPDHRHPHLSHGDCVPCIIRGGDWAVTIPAECSVTCHVAYLSAHADDDGWGTLVERELEAAVTAVAQADPWLRDHPPEVRWSYDVPPWEIAEDAPIVREALAAAADVGFATRTTGMDSWHDGATLSLRGGTPAICLGPGDLDVAHTADEHVPVADLVRCAQALALVAIRFCGVAV